MTAVLPEHQWWCMRGPRAVRCGADPQGCDCGAGGVAAYIEDLQACIESQRATIVELLSQSST